MGKRDSPSIYKNISVELKDKCVFYSPSYQYSIDFSVETKQGIYLYQR